MAKKEEKKKPIFEKVGIVFRSPVRADIMKQLSESPQRPKKLADEIGIQRQNINYHLNALKKLNRAQVDHTFFTPPDIGYIAVN